MSRFRLGHSTAPDARGAAEDCAAAVGRVASADAVGFVYATDGFADRFADIVGHLRAATGVRHWFGTVGIGACATGAEIFDGPGLAALVGTFPAGSVSAFDGGAAAAGATFGVVHAIPTDRAVLDAIDGCARTSGAYLVGGLASSRGAHVAVAGDAFASRGATGALFAPEVAVATGLTQGCVPLGPVHRVTKGTGTNVATIDGEPAVNVLAADLARSGNPRGAAGLQVAFPIQGSDTGDYVVRNLMGVDSGSGALAVAHEVAPGDAIQFCRRDEAAARADLDRMLRDLKRRAPAPRGALYFSCLARGPNLFEPGAELATIAEAYPDLPLAGFFGNGEICAGRLYAYTGVLALFL